MRFDTASLTRCLPRWVPGLFAALVLAGCQTVGPEAAEFTYSGTMTYDTTEASITTQPLRELATLDQAVVGGKITVFVEPHQRLSEVSFYLDDPDLTGDPILTDSSVPYDLRLDTTALTDGDHTLTAVTHLGRGKAKTLESATFLTANREYVPLRDEQPSSAIGSN